MARGSADRKEEGKPGSEAPLLSVESVLMPLDQPVPTAPAAARRHIAALLSAARTRCAEIVRVAARAVQKSLPSRGYSLTSEHGLGAIGIAIAGASICFAALMILQDHQEPRDGGALEEKVALDGRELGHFANADVDPMTTGSITPMIGATKQGVAGAGDGVVRVEPSAPKLQGYVLRDVFEGVALVEGSDGISAVQPGFTLSGGNKVMAIERHDGKWVVVTTGGIIAENP